MSVGKDATQGKKDLFPFAENILPDLIGDPGYRLVRVDLLLAKRTRVIPLVIAHSIVPSCSLISFAGIHFPAPPDVQTENRQSVQRPLFIQYTTAKRGRTKSFLLGISSVPQSLSLYAGPIG